MAGDRSGMSSEQAGYPVTVAPAVLEAFSKDNWWAIFRLNKALEATVGGSFGRAFRRVTTDLAIRSHEASRWFWKADRICSSAAKRRPESSLGNGAATMANGQLGPRKPSGASGYLHRGEVSLDPLSTGL
ncbi:predicted protein [Verticillium alfalfae VaMs.102]|uniref:Predicted protein n=1 Tax=Verticillium alfalfae (strain VaMs.102 / ATCC MYA-4576 / FGSC 10136) TaxID=526221 RepID=C9SF04_VERA1|nr:predicted protein [Verticillium alfalfae VaMs.102]EEY17790.1 predicted protein [Verticillium alfalfae VaMs.102]